MANRRRRRRRRSARRRSSLPTPLILGVVAAVAVVGLGVFAYSKGAFASLGDSSDRLSGVSASSSRFEGADGIDVGMVAPPAYWWTDIASQVSIGDASEVDLDPDGGFDTQYQRVLIPADLLFAADSAELSDTAREAVSTIAASVSDPSLKIIVVCHSSADGSVEARLTLSEQRADELATLLEELLQRPANSIVRIGKGDTEPLPGIDQGTSSGRALNRRCEIFIQFP